MGLAQVHFSKLYDLNNGADAGSSVIEINSGYFMSGGIYKPKQYTGIVHINHR